MHLIVGVDPGIKTAFAAIDLNGKLVRSGTLKEADADRIVEEIAKIGIPSVVATDVNPAPSFVLKISARFNVRTFAPFRALLEKEKREIAPSTENLHERDALSAAIKCYRIYANRLRQIEGMETTLNKDRLKHLVIQGFTLRNAMLMLEKKDEKIIVGKKNSPKVLDKDAELVSLSEENVNLKKALDAERKNVSVLESEIAKIQRVNYVQIGKDSEIRKLKSEIEKLTWMVRKLRKKLA